MMLCRNATYRPERFQPGEYPLGVVRMQAYALPLCLRKWPRLIPDRVGDADATQIMKEACPPDGPHIDFWQATALCRLRCQVGNAARMTKRVRRFQISEISNSPQDLVQACLGDAGARTRLGGQNRLPHGGFACILKHLVGLAAAAVNDGGIVHPACSFLEHRERPVLSLQAGKDLRRS